MKLLALTIALGALLQLSSAQFRQQNNQRFRFDSDEFDNDFDDLFDRRSRERNSFEFNSIERDSDEVIGNIRDINPATINSFRQANSLNRRDSIEVDRFGTITVDRDSDEIISRGRNRNPFVQRNPNPFRNQPSRNRNSFDRNSFESFSSRRRPASRFGFDSVEVPIIGNRGNVIGFDSVEVRTPGFRRNSIERDSFEIRRPINTNRNPFRQAGFNVNSISTDSPEDIFEDLFDDDADDRARARLALQQLQQQRNRQQQTSGINRQFGVQSSSFGQQRNPFTQNAQQANRNTFTNNVAQRNPFLTSIPRPSVRPRQNSFNNLNTFPSGNSRTVGRPLPSSNQGSNSRNSGARFPPQPLSPFRQRTPSQFPRVSPVSTGVNSNFNRNDNRNNRLTVNNPFSPRSSSPGRPLPSSRQSNLRPIPPLPSIPRNQPSSPTTSRPIVASRITTPRPVITTRRTTPRPFVPTTPRRTPRPIPTTTPRPFRPTSPPRRNFNNNNSIRNPFRNAARLNNAVEKSSRKPSNNPFIRRGSSNSIHSGDSKLGSVGGFSRNKTPRKSLPAVVPMGFDWPGGNGYFFRMSTGNSKPIEYFISYDD